MNFTQYITINLISAFVLIRFDGVLDQK